MLVLHKYGFDMIAVIKLIKIFYSIIKGRFKLFYNFYTIYTINFFQFCTQYRRNIAHFGKIVDFFRMKPLVYLFCPKFFLAKLLKLGFQLSQTVG